MNRPALIAVLAALSAGAPASVLAQKARPVTTARADDATPVLVSADQWRAMAEAGDRYPMFSAERQRVEREVRVAMAAGINVPQPRDLGGLQPAGQLADDQTFELHADIKNVARILPARRDDHGNPVAAELDQTFGSQLPKRMTRDGAADAKSVAERILGQFCTGLQRLLDDRTPKGATNHPDFVF